MIKMSPDPLQLDAKYFLALRGLQACRQAGLKAEALPELQEHLLALEAAIVARGEAPVATAALLVHARSSWGRTRLFFLMAKHFPQSLWGQRSVGRVGYGYVEARSTQHHLHWQRVVKRCVNQGIQKGMASAGTGSVPEGIRCDVRYGLALRAWGVCRQGGLPKLAALEALLAALEHEWVGAQRPPEFTLQRFLHPGSRKPCLRLAHVMAKHFPENPWADWGREALKRAFLTAKAQENQWAKRVQQDLEGAPHGAS